MKKINLKGISEILSENELKNVMGGSETNCYKCSNGTIAACNANQNGCFDFVSDYCPGGWIQWTAGVTGPSCF